MKIYLVGGAVRDKLLGWPVKERDWVVVGATVRDMQQLGYQQVGKEFPVFLHPKTGEEYALARMERKVQLGYKGFTFDTSPDVSLEDDLQRRDLTINAMAESPAGELIDPYHGKEDLAKKILRHVSHAFVEDPVRILRVGRFYARYGYLGFQIAKETLQLMQEMVARGEVNALVAERVWKELERALQEKNPENFFIVLAECNALTILFPSLDIKGAGIQALKQTVLLTDNPTIRFASLLYSIPEPKKNITQLARRYRIPNAYYELALLTAIYHSVALSAQRLSAEELLSLFHALDIFRRPERFQHFLLALQGISQAQQIHFIQNFLLDAAEKAKSVNVQTLIAQGFANHALALQLKTERIKKIQQWLDEK